MLLAVLAVLASGCGAATRDGPTVTVDAIADSTSAAGSARMSMTMTSTLPQIGETKIQVAGITTLDDDVEQLVAELTMTMDVGFGNGDLESSLRLIRGRTFVRGAFAEAMGIPQAGGGWAEVDAERRDALLAMGGGAPGTGPTDPTAALDALTAIAGLEPAGREEVRGTDTRRLSATTTLAALLEAQGVDWEQSMRDQEALSGQPAEPVSDELVATANALPVEVDLWIDDEDRLRRSRTSVDMAPMWRLLLPAGDAPDGEALMVMDMEFYDYGAPVDVAIPEGASPDAVSPSDVPAGQPTAGMAATDATATVTISGGQLDGTHEAQGSCMTGGYGEGVELGIHLQVLNGAEWATTMIVRTTFASGSDPTAVLMVAIPEDDGQVRTVEETVAATVDVGPETERSAREYVDVTVEGEIEGDPVTAEIHCAPEG